MKILREQEKNPENQDLCSKYKVSPSVTEKHITYKLFCSIKKKLVSVSTK